LYVLGGGPGLVQLKDWLREQPRPRNVFVERFQPTGKVDFLIVDTAPGWDIISENVLRLVNEVLVPVALQPASVAAYPQFAGFISEARKLNPELAIKYVCPTVYDRRTGVSDQLLRQLRESLGSLVTEPIRYSSKLSEAVAFNKSIFSHDPRGKGAEDYAKLARRVADG
jgi:chromosome partitioning protein